MPENNIIKIDSVNSLYGQISDILKEARTKVSTTINTAMVAAYWHIGKLIVEAQGGESKARYGDGLIDTISSKLTKEFGRGFKRSNLRDMRQFYLTFPIYQTLSGKLSWSHYLALLRVSNAKARQYYAEEAAKAPWSVRQLERQIGTQYYERLLATHMNNDEVKEIIEKNLPINPEKYDPLKLVHDPLVLEFLDLKEDPALQESELESAILSHIEDNPTVGLILCTEKNDTVIEYTLGNRNDIGVFASKYKLMLPTEEELRREIEISKENFKRLKG